MNPGWMKASFAWKRGPLIPDDANTVAHVYFRNGALVDSYGNSWTQNGTMPQVSASGKIPPGSGPSSDTNNYSLGSGNDVLDFTGNFSICMIVGASSSYAAQPVTFCNGLYNSNGYYIGFNTTGHLTMGVGPGGIMTATSNAIISGVPNVVCVGINFGTSTWVQKLNLGTVVTAGSASLLPATGRIAYLGRYNTAGQPWLGTIYEAWFSTTLASDAAFTTLATQIKATLGISAW